MAYSVGSNVVCYKAKSPGGTLGAYLYKSGKWYAIFAAHMSDFKKLKVMVNKKVIGQVVYIDHQTDLAIAEVNEPVTWWKRLWFWITHRWEGKYVTNIFPYRFLRDKKIPMYKVGTAWDKRICMMLSKNGHKIGQVVGTVKVQLPSTGYIVEMVEIRLTTADTQHGDSGSGIYSVVGEFLGLAVSAGETLDDRGTDLVYALPVGYVQAGLSAIA